MISIGGCRCAHIVAFDGGVGKEEVLKYEEPPTLPVAFGRMLVTFGRTP